MYHCFNVVTGQRGFPAAVLVRALEPGEGLEAMRDRRDGRPDEQLTSGPGRLCEALAIDLQFDGVDLCSPEASLFLEVGDSVLEEGVTNGPRVNVRGDEAAVSVPWRFYVKGNRYVSR
jgi:DNA-3-methyladenine glycosylase